MAAVLLMVGESAWGAIPATEREALVALYSATGGPRWTRSSGWLGAPETECTWFGVRCRSDGSTVTELELSANNLQGPLPAELARLTNLEWLRAALNLLEGPIPPELGQLQRVEFFDFAVNDLSGEIPRELGGLAAAIELDLSSNRLTGTIPPELGQLSRLETLDLSGNELTGPIPTQLSALQQLEMLDLESNELTGTIPPQLGNLSRLEWLQLGFNRLTGPIPAELGNLTALQILSLFSNRLSGPIPRELGRLRNLEQLVMFFTGLSGTVPAELSNLTSLELLLLSGNDFSGELPDLGSLTRLQYLGFSNSQLGGPLPEWLWNLRNLRSLVLNSNRFTGELSPLLGQLTALETLWLFNNQLSGPIPATIGQLTNLKDLWLSENPMGGPIPPAIGQLKNLESLNLYDLGLTGSIPNDLLQLTKLRSLDLSTNLLEGSIPTGLGGLRELRHLALGGNRLTGEIPAELRELTNLEGLFLYSNRLSGPVPAFLATLPKLRSISLSINELSGTIPPELGSMSQLENLSLDFNQLTGRIPTELGNLASLELLGLGFNHLEGEIPPGLGRLSNLDFGLFLESNRLSGAIPSELGSLTNLSLLWLTGNQLRGEIPRSLLNLRNLFSFGLQLDLNALKTTDPELRTFLLSKSGEWESTQAVPPANVRVAGATARSVALSWDRQVNDPALEYPGGYEVSVSTASTGAPLKILTTPNRVVSAMTVSDLSPQTTYFFTVRSVIYPNDLQQSLLVSDPAPAISAATTADVPAPAQVLVLQFPFGLVQIEGAPSASDQYILKNVGDQATSITVTQQGDFFTQAPGSFTLAGGEERAVVLQALPRSPGAYEGSSVPAGTGVASGTSIPVRLLTGARPDGTVLAQPVANRVDVSAPEEVTTIAATAGFRNAGNGTLRGVLVSNVSWIIPQSGLVVIAPGATVTVSFTVDRLRRQYSATATGELALVYLSTATAAGMHTPMQGPSAPGTSKAVVTVVDTVAPGSSTGELPPLAPGEVALFVAGVGHVTGGVGTFVSDISISNAFGILPLRDVRILYTPAIESPSSQSAAIRTLETGEAVKLGDVVKTVFNADQQVGTLQIRTRDWDKLAVNANIFNVSNPAGTYGTVIPVFRSDRALFSGESLYLTGLRKDETSRSNLFVQETSGATATVVIDFLDSAGAVISSLRETVPPFRLLRLIDRVPPGGVTAKLTNDELSAGRLAAYATPVDQASGDFWAVVDWAQHFGLISVTDKAPRPVLIPIAGTVRGANNTFFRTDLSMINKRGTAGTATIRYLPRGASAITREVILLAEASTTFRDIAGELFGTTASLGYLMVEPRPESDFVVTSRTFATVGDLPGSYGSGVPVLPPDRSLRRGQTRVISGIDISSVDTIRTQKPATFRTNIGLVETAGQPATVRVTILYADGRAKVIGELAAFEQQLSVGEFVLISDLSDRLAASGRTGDLRDVQLVFEVTAGTGAVTVFTSTVDNGTGDSIFRLE